MGHRLFIVKTTLMVAALASPFVFTAGFTILITLMAGMFSPLTPFAVGLLVDSLYWSPSVSTLPWYSVFGALTSLTLLFGYRVLKSEIM
jgi:hypothetical protein